MKRPRIISIICILGYITIVFTFPQVFSPSVKKLGIFMPALYGLLVALNFIACVGLWYFKRWGAELYVFSFLAKTIFFMLTAQTGFGFYAGTFLSVVFTLVLLKFYPKMSRNL